MLMDDYKELEKLPESDYIVELSNGRIIDLTKEDLTTQDIREMSGVEVRYIRASRRNNDDPMFRKTK